MVLGDNGTKYILTEDISPHKIALCVLIYLYSNDDIEQDILNAVLEVIVSFLEDNVLRNREGNEIVIPELDNIFYNLERAIQSSYEMLTEENQIKVENDSRVIETLLYHKLWTIRSTDDLHLQIKEFSKIVVDSSHVFVDEKTSSQFKRPILSRSLLGTFIRKIVATYNLLSYDEEALLFDAFLGYRTRGGKIAEQLKLERSGIFSTSNSEVSKLNSLSGINEPPKLFNKCDYETSGSDSGLFFNRLSKLLDDGLGIQVPVSPIADPHNPSTDGIITISRSDIKTLLDNQINLLESNGTKIPKSLNDVMNLMISPSSNTTSVQHTGLNNLPSYYYLRYLQALHDLDYQNAFKSLHQYFDYMVSNNSKYFYHFALVSLASLHQFFGEDEKALDAIQEAISVARENKDNNTLTYILCWLFNFMKNRPALWNQQSFYNNDSEQHMFAFLMEKSQRVSLSLYTMSFHFETLHIMNNAGAMSKYLESLLKGTFVSINDHLLSFIRSMEMSSTVWNRIGVNTLSEMYSDIALQTVRKVGNLEEELSIEIRRAYISFFKGETESSYTRLKELTTLIKDDEFYSRNLLIRIKILGANLDLKKGRYKASETLTEELMNNEINDIELEVEFIHLAAQAQICIGNYIKALEFITRALKLIESFISQTQVNLHLIMKLNILKCKVYREAGACAKAISLIIQQIQHAKKVGFITIVLEGLIMLASILNVMDQHSDSQKILNVIMPEVLTLDSMELTASSFYELSVTYSRMIDITESAEERSSLLKAFLAFLDSSVNSFKKVGDSQSLRKCLELEKHVASVMQLEELYGHAVLSLKKIEERSLKEVLHNFI